MANVDFFGENARIYKLAQNKKATGFVTCGYNIVAVLL